MSERSVRQRTTTRNTPLVAALAITLAYVPGALADADTTVKTGDGWEFRGAAYLWIANITGTQTVKGQEADLDVSFGDVLDVLDFAAEAHLEGMKDNRWGFFLDGTYLKLGPEAKQGPIDIRVGYRYWLWELGGVYRTTSWATDNGHAAVDLLLGGRYTSMDVDLDFRNVPSADIEDSESW